MIMTGVFVKEKFHCIMCFSSLLERYDMIMSPGFSQGPVEPKYAFGLCELDNFMRRSTYHGIFFMI